ncbi:hypothetical protein M9Y10_006507 [Tritrichomonas musculus]|uniref:Nuclear pore complex protein n=1 Tax=Tritrichomonas musculus TaxID=1915356 RepID=A0ABR2JED9_9EUKA
MSEQEVLSKLYAQPLLNRGEKTASEICKEYFSDLCEYKSSKYQEEARIWLLLSYLHDKSLKIPELYSNIISKNSKLELYVRFFLWLNEIYSFTRGNKEKSYSNFEYFRSGQEEKFLEKVQSSQEEEKWKLHTFSGAFSSNHFKLWRESVYDISETKNIKKDVLDLYLSLAGDKKINKKHEHNIFDRMWTQIYYIISLALSEKQFSFKFDNLTPNKSSQFETMAISVFKNISNDINVLYNDSTNPLLFRVHVAATFNQLPIELLQSYMTNLFSMNLMGLSIFYASLANKDNSIFLLADFFAAFEPSKDIIDAVDSFNIDKERLICMIIERLSESTIEDFEVQIDKGEITEIKIKCLEWFSLVPSLKNRTLENVRKILSSLVINDEYEGALTVFNKFSDLFNENHKKELNCWESLILAENEYLKWSKGDKTTFSTSSFNSLKEVLENVIRFPPGWMVECPEVDPNVGCHCIPLIAEHLYHFYMENNETEKAMGIGIYIINPLYKIQRYFSPKSLRHFVELSKKAAIENYRKSNK